jgi:hypothetical protein
MLLDEKRSFERQKRAFSGDFRLLLNHIGLRIIQLSGVDLALRCLFCLQCQTRRSHVFKKNWSMAKEETIIMTWMSLSKFSITHTVVVESTHRIDKEYQ